MPHQHLAEIQNVPESAVPVELMPSLAWVPIHSESKFCCER